MNKTDILQNMGNGKFKTLKAGEVTLTATAQDGSGVKATCRVVVKNPMATQVLLNETQHNTIVDDVFTLTAKVMPEKAAQNVVWTMDKTNILQDLGNGKFKALKAGEVTLTATAQDGSGVKTTCHVTVKNPMATQVVLNETQHNAIIDAVFTLTAKVMPEKAAQNVVWTMDKTNILQDMGDGKFKALKAGEVTLTATAQDGSGVKATCHVIVVPPTALDFQKDDASHSLQWEGATLVLYGAKIGSTIRVYSMKGKKLHQFEATDSVVRIDFGLWHGVYLLETSDGFRRKVVH